jgi:hypothetical protein
MTVAARRGAKALRGPLLFLAAPLYLRPTLPFASSERHTRLLRWWAEWTQSRL